MMLLTAFYQQASAITNINFKKSGQFASNSLIPGFCQSMIFASMDLGNLFRKIFQLMQGGFDIDSRLAAGLLKTCFAMTTVIYFLFFKKMTGCRFNLNYFANGLFFTKHFASGFQF
jgi:hypothetical protein